MLLTDFDLFKINSALSEYRDFRAYRKIFSIGLPKTGTTSIKNCMSVFGFNIPPVNLDNSSYISPMFKGKFNRFCDHIGAFDFFTDFPFCYGHTFLQADALFPHSKFILTLRNPPDWVESFSRFWEKKLGFDPLRLVDYTESEIIELLGPFRYEWLTHYFPSSLYDIWLGEKMFSGSLKFYFDRDFLIDMCLKRVCFIREYFAQRPDQLLVIDVQKEPDISRLSHFLGFPGFVNFDMPHAYKTPTGASHAAGQSADDSYCSNYEKMMRLKRQSISIQNVDPGLLAILES